MQVSEFPFAEGLDTTSLLLAGSLFLFSILLVQMIWVYRRRSSSPILSSETDGNEAVEAEGTEDDMVLCPECSQPTEAEYRYCRHCASDTGRSYVGSRGDDGSNRSGML